jgi:hypothetical protein
MIGYLLFEHHGIRVECQAFHCQSMKTDVNVHAYYQEGNYGKQSTLSPFGIRAGGFVVSLAAGTLTFTAISSAKAAYCPTRCGSYTVLGLGWRKQRILLLPRQG